jgi:UDPglucose--hexose-1-phosphate uridylyltransferase
MELRKDPITRSWVITGDDADRVSHDTIPCRYCPDGQNAPQVISSMPSVDGGPWSARAVVHPEPLYRIEGDPQRRGEGLYDKMRAVGAHELIVENPRHGEQLWQATPAHVEQFLSLIGQRIQDLKRDKRFKYVTLFKNYGLPAGQETAHPTSLLTATTFVPRRVLYELRSARDYYSQKERCVFCDIIAQELQQAVRVVESTPDFVALCPYASRVPYETWLMPREHQAYFERDALGKGSKLGQMALLLKHTLQRVLAISENFHMVLHTAPNTEHKGDVLDYWRTLDEDFHWHLEILPILAQKSKSYSFKETYFSPVSPETAAKKLREASVS